MGNNLKATTIGTLHKDIFFKKKVSISFDNLNYDNTADYKVLVQIEPPSIMNIVNHVLQNKNNFDLILTWNPKILSECSNSILFPFGSSWINQEDRGIHNKNKLLSIISSDKKQTEGHLLRHQIINQNSQLMDVFGYGYNPIKNKCEGLKDYMFSLIIENENTDNWFTEKLIDCLVNGTIPVYWGCHNIHKFFNPNGFIVFNTIDELNLIIPTLTKETYDNMLPFIDENFNISLNYVDFWGRVENTIKNKPI